MNTHTTIKWIDNMMIVSESASSHAVAIDPPQDLDGKNLGIHLIKILFLSMGYCGSIGMISTLKKMHQEVCNCHFEILAERAKKHLKKFTKIHIYFVIEDADLNDKKIGRTSGPIC